MQSLRHLVLIYKVFVTHGGLPKKAPKLKHISKCVFQNAFLDCPRILFSITDVADLVLVNLSHITETSIQMMID